MTDSQSHTCTHSNAHAHIQTHTHTFKRTRTQLAGRTLRVDHVRNYEAPEIREMQRMQRKGKLQEFMENKAKAQSDSGEGAEQGEGEQGAPAVPVREALLKELRGEGRVAATGELVQHSGRGDEDDTESADSSDERESAEALDPMRAFLSKSTVFGIQSETSSGATYALMRGATGL